MSNINIGEIAWEEPPVSTAPGSPGRPRQSALREFAAVLRLRPGQWAKYPKLTKAGYSTSTFREMGIPDVQCTTRRVRLANGEYLTATYARAIPQDERVNA